MGVAATVIDPSSVVPSYSRISQSTVIICTRISIDLVTKPCAKD